MGMLIEYAACAFDAFIAIFFITRFCGGSLKKNYKAYAAMLLLFGVTVLTLHIQTDPMVELLGDFLIKLVYALSLTDRKFIKRLISPIVFELVLVLVNTTIVFTVTNLFSLNMNDVVYTLFWGRYLYILACKIIMTAILMIILRLFELGDRFTLTDLLLYLIFPVVTVMTLYIFLKLGVEFDLSKYSIMIIASILGLCAINVLTLVFFKRASDSEAARHELELIQSRDEIEKEKYAEMGAIYENLRIARHDIRDLLSSIRQMLREKDYGSVTEYIDVQEQVLDDSYKVFHTGNRLIDYIIYTKVSSAPELGFSVSGNLSELESISDMDLAALFGNMINNAVEAALESDEKKIVIEFSYYNNHQSIFCKNSVKSPVLADNPDLVTSKTDKQRHGLGVKSIRHITEQNGGLLEFYEEDGMFCVHAAFPIKKVCL